MSALTLHIAYIEYLKIWILAYYRFSSIKSNWKRVFGMVSVLAANSHVYGYKKVNGCCISNVFNKFIELKVLTILNWGNECKLELILIFSSFTIGQSARQVALRQKSDLSPDFHAKYGPPLLIAGATFCTAVWAYVCDCEHELLRNHLSYFCVLYVILCTVFAGDHINRHCMEPVTCGQGAAQAMAGGVNAFP